MSKLNTPFLFFIDEVVDQSLDQISVSLVVELVLIICTSIA